MENNEKTPPPTAIPSVTGRGEAEKEAEKRYPDTIGMIDKDAARKQRKNQKIFIEGAHWFASLPAPAHPEGQGVEIYNQNFKINFTDCWGFDKLIPEDGRWLANINGIASVVAPTKEKAFEEMMISLRALLLYKSSIIPSSLPASSPSPGSPDWVSVEERLPEEGQDVLGVHNEAGGIQIVWYDHEEKRWEAIDLDPLHTLLISHWRPLPTPPNTVLDKNKK